MTTGKLLTTFGALVAFFTVLVGALLWWALRHPASFLRSAANRNILEGQPTELSARSSRSASHSSLSPNACRRI